MRAAAALLLSVLLTACGWQLRGAAMMGLSGVPIAVETEEASGEFVQDLRAALRGAGANLVPRAAAAAVVILEDDIIHQRSLAVTTRAVSREYELEYLLRYRVETPDGEWLTGSEPVSRVRSYRYDAAEALAGEARGTQLRGELRAEVVRAVVLRVQALVGHQE